MCDRLVRGVPKFSFNVPLRLLLLLVVNGKKPFDIRTKRKLRDGEGPNVKGKVGGKQKVQDNTIKHSKHVAHNNQTGAEEESDSTI